jgi:hypothetical protein
VYNDANSTQAQVDAAAAELRARREGLVRRDGRTLRAFISVIDPHYFGLGQPRVFFPGTWFDIQPSETAYDILRRTDLDIDSRGGGIWAGMYVASIEGWGEFDAGPLSGWMYRVNGVFPEFSSRR